MDCLDDCYAFETNSDMLKNNTDYQNLMTTFCKLQAQRIQAIKRLEKLYEAKEKFLKNPLALVNALQNGESLDLPTPLAVIELPEIDWSKYDIEGIIQCSKPKTRKSNFKDTSTSDSEKTSVPEKDEVGNHNDKPKLVRGRLFSDDKPHSFNQLWTHEEQRKLEELLMKYPDEATAARRYAKIAQELGSRTVPQVQSRIQKYFIALKRKGLPVPGRNPRTLSLKYPGKTRRKFTQSRTSFMRAFDFEGFPSSVPDETIEESYSEGDCSTSKILNISVSDEEDITDEVKETSEYKEYMKLKKLKKLKLKEVETGIVIHPGFECSICNMNPIKGTRWHCTECASSSSPVDLCSACMKARFQTNTHSHTHSLFPVNAMSVEDTMKIL